MLTLWLPGCPRASPQAGPGGCHRALAVGVPGADPRPCATPAARAAGTCRDSKALAGTLVSPWAAEGPHAAVPLEPGCHPSGARRVWSPPGEQGPLLGARTPQGAGQGRGCPVTPETTTGQQTCRRGAGGSAPLPGWRPLLSRWGCLSLFSTNSGSNPQFPWKHRPSGVQHKGLLRTPPQSLGASQATLLTHRR